MARYKDLQTTIIGGNSPFRREKDVFRTNDGLVVHLKEELPPCVHGHLIHSTAEMIGQCTVCDGYICRRCKILRCSLDNDLVCRNDCFIRDGKVICRKHGLIRLMVFYFKNEKR